MLKSVTLLASLAPYLNLVPYVDAQSQGSNMVPLGGASVAFICPNGNYMQFTSISGNNVMSCSGGTQPDVGPFAMLNNFNVDSNGTGSAQALTDGGTYYLNVQGHGATEFMTATPYNRPNDNGDYTLQTSTYGGPSGTGFHNYECAFNFYIQPDGRYKIQAIANNGPYNSNAMPIHDGPDEGYWSVQSDETIFTPNTVGPGDADIFSIVLAPTSSVQQSFATSDNLDSNTEFTIQNSITGNFWEYTNGVYSATASQSSASTFMISNSTIHTGLNGLFDISRNQYVSIPSNSSAATGSTSEITRETEMIIIPVGSQQYVIWTQTNPGAYLTSADGGLYPTGSEPEVNTFVAIGSTAVAKPTIETMTTFSSSTLDSAPSSTTSENLSFTSSNSVVTSAVSTSSDLVEPTAITGLSTSSSTSLTYQVTATSEPLPSTTSAPMVAFTTVSSSLSAVLTSDAVVPSPMANNGAAASSSSSSAAAAAAGAQSATDFSEFVSSTSSAVSQTESVATSAAFTEVGSTMSTSDILSTTTSAADATIPTASFFTTDVLGTTDSTTMPSGTSTIESERAVPTVSSLAALDPIAVMPTSSLSIAESTVIASLNRISTSSEGPHYVTATIAMVTSSLAVTEATAADTLSKSSTSSTTKLTSSTSSLASGTVNIGSLDSTSVFGGYKNVSSTLSASSSALTSGPTSRIVSSAMSTTAAPSATTCSVVLAGYACNGSANNYGAFISATRAQACADSCSSEVSCQSFVVDAQGSCMTYDNVPDCFADATSPECTQLAEDSDALRFVKVTVATPSMSTVSVARISIFSAPSVTLSSTTPSSSSSLTPVPASSSSFGSGAAVAALSQSGLTTSTRSAVALPVGETGIANLPVETSASASAPVLSPSATSSAGNAVSANQEDSAPNASAANTAPNSQEVSIGDEATFNPSPSGSDVSAAQVVGRPINVSNNASDIATSPSGSVASVDSAESGVTNNTDFSTAAVMGTIASITSVTAPAASYQSTLVTKIAGETTVLSSASMATASTGSDVSNENGGTASTYAPSPSSTPSTASSSSSTGMPSVAALPASTSDSSALKSTMSCLAAVLSVLFFI